MTTRKKIGDYGAPALIPPAQQKTLHFITPRHSIVSVTGWIFYKWNSHFVYRHEKKKTPLFSSMHPATKSEAPCLSVSSMLMTWASCPPTEKPLRASWAAASHQSLVTSAGSITDNSLPSIHDSYNKGLQDQERPLPSGFSCWVHAILFRDQRSCIGRLTFNSSSNQFFCIKNLWTFVHHWLKFVLFIGFLGISGYSCRNC